jgi:hypothetical protein
MAARDHVEVPDGVGLSDLSNAYRAQARLDLAAGGPSFGR